MIVEAISEAEQHESAIRPNEFCRAARLASAGCRDDNDRDTARGAGFLERRQEVVAGVFPFRQGAKPDQRLSEALRIPGGTGDGLAQQLTAAKPR